MLDRVLDAHALTRRFGARTAVSDLSLTLARGEIVALLGPNGAGKTTTLRMLAGLIQPTSGTVRLTGSSGLLTESPGLWDTLTVQLNLMTYARLHALPAATARVADGLAAVGLADRAGDRAGELSKGLRQRVAIARTLLHDPAVLLLDEPTSGLDPASARHVRDLITSLARQGRGVLISTHNLAEAEALADRIAILKVHLLALETPAQLRQHTGTARVDVGVDSDAAPWAVMLRDRHGLHAEAHDGHVTVTIEAQTQVADVVAALVHAGARITSVVPQRRTLEDVYLELVGRS